MSRIMKPAETLLFGRAMLSQLTGEMDLLGARNPVMVTAEPYVRRARRAAAMLDPGYAQPLELTGEKPSAVHDFLILAGGKEVVDAYASDPRPKAWIILGDEDLEDFLEPRTEFLVVDASFVRDTRVIDEFFRKFALAISDGLASCPGALSVPGAFAYSCGTTVYAGDEAVAELPGLLAASGVKRPMILTDRGIIAAGILDRLSTVLSGYDTEVFSDIPPDSSSRVVNEISRLYSEKDRDGIIALGGGSVIDTGKGVRIDVSLGVKDLFDLAGSNRVPGLDTPFFVLPTTAGTGSEVTKVAVISDEERCRKILYVSENLQPDYSILDSRFTASLPPQLTSITAMDALAHAVEAFTCLGKNPVSDQMAWKAVELIRDNLVPCLGDPSNLDFRRNLALAASMAGQAFSNSMVGVIHTIGHSVGTVCHAPHGSCMTVLMPASLEFNYDAVHPLLSKLLSALAGEAYAGSIPPADRARAAIGYIRKMNRNLKELTGGLHPEGLGDIRGRNGETLVRESDFPRIAEISLGDASIIYNPVEARREDILGILEASY